MSSLRNHKVSPVEALCLGGARLLMTASTGGHLAELQRYASMINPSPDSLIVTFDSPQSRSLKTNVEVRFVPYIEPRDVRGVMAGRHHFRMIQRSRRFDATLSTGSAIALAALPVAVKSMRAIYIESYGRFDGPSMTGRILSHVLPRVELYTQHRYDNDRWIRTNSILESVTSAPLRPKPGRPRVFITLGTIAPYRFDALVDRVLKIAPPGAELVWQLGSTTRTDLPGEVHEHMDHAAFIAQAHSASVVVSHAGVGTALELIEMGHRPVLVPRQARRKEHVDDHQVQVVCDLARRGLVINRGVDELEQRDLATT